jgi:hypothetical protein
MSHKKSKQKQQQAKRPADKTASKAKLRLATSVKLVWLKCGLPITLLSIVVNFLTLATILPPRLDLRPLAASTKTFIFENPFILSNNSFYEIKEIKCKAGDTNYTADASKPLIMYSRSRPDEPVDRNMVLDLGSLASGSSKTFEIAPLLGLLVERAEKAYFVLHVTFRPYGIPISLERKFRFKLFRTPQGDCYWSKDE